MSPLQLVDDPEALLMIRRRSKAADDLQGAMFLGSLPWLDSTQSISNENLVDTASKKNKKRVTAQA